MFKVLILVCSIDVIPPDCDSSPGYAVVSGPEAANEIACGFNGQAYLAQTALAEGIGRDFYLKVRCVHHAKSEIEHVVSAPTEMNCLSRRHHHLTELAPTAAVRRTPLDESVPTSVPVWRTVTLGTHESAETLRKALKDSGCLIGRTAEAALLHSVFLLSQIRKEMDLAVVSVGQLGLGAEGASPAAVYTRASQIGLELCPAEIAPQLRLQYPDQPVGEFLHVAMEPIDIDDGDPIRFVVGNGGAGLVLFAAHSDPDAIIPPTVRYVFVRPR